MRTNNVLLMAIAMGIFFSSCQKEQAINTETSAGKKHGAVTSATQDNTVTNFFKRNSATAGSVAFDQAFSVKLASGKVLWLNGDTYYNDYDATNGTTGCYFTKHNTVLQQPSTTNWTWSSTTNLTYAGESQIFTSVTPGNYYWPATGIETSAGKVLVYLNELNSSHNVIGQQLGTLDVATKAVSYPGYPYTIPNLNGINFGLGMMKVGSYIYVYGYKIIPGGYGAVNIYLARFLPTNTNVWDFYKGAKGGDVNTASNWSTNSAVSTVLGIGQSSGTNISPVNGKYVMISTAFSMITSAECVTNGRPKGIYASFSTKLTGNTTTGFPNQTWIYDIPDQAYGLTPWFYTPIIHPAFQTATDFLFTYCINNFEPCFPACNAYGRATADYYRPRGVRVPFTQLPGL